MTFNEKKVDEIISWFQNTEVFDLAELFSKAKYLSTQTRPLSQLVGAANKKYNHAHMMRRVVFINKRKHFMDTLKCSKAKAEMLAEESEEWTKWFKDEYTYKALHENGKSWIASIKMILGRMNQELAEMREEKKNYIQEELMEKIIKKINIENRQLAQST